MNVMEQNVIIAIDHSPQAENAVKFYLERVHRPGNKVIFIHCVELPELSLNKAKDSHMSPAVLAGMWKEEEARTKILEEKMAGLLKEKEVPGILRTSAGKPGEVICAIADEERAAMIITGTRGMGKMRRTILGSVSDFLVNHAVCPVMVCRDPAEVERRRHASGGGGKLRHPSGDAAAVGSSFAANLRQRFASGNRARSQCDRDDGSPQKKETGREKRSELRREATVDCGGGGGATDAPESSKI